VSVEVYVKTQTGRVYRWEDEIEDLRWADAKIRGTQYIRANLRRKINVHYDDLELWNKIWVMDGIDQLASAFIGSTPKESADKKITINAPGWWAHGKDDKIQKIYCDTRYSAWKNKVATGGNQYDISDMYSNQTDLQLRINCRKDQNYPLNYSNQFVYEALSGHILDKISFDWASNYTNTYFRARLYSWNGTDWYLEWENSATGSQSGSENKTLRANTTKLVLRLQCISAYNYTSDDGAWYARFTNIKIYGDYGVSSIYASEVIKDSVEKCPLISSDTTDISDTTYTIEPLIFEDYVEPQRIWLEVNKYHNHVMGIRGKHLLNGQESSDGLPAFFFYELDKTKINYYTDLAHAEPSLSGPSIEHTFNRVPVKYQDVNGRTVYEMREDTSTDNYVNKILNAGKSSSDPDWVWKTADPITAETTSQTKAQKVGDVFLDEYKRLRNQGTIKVKGTIEADNRAEIPVHRIRSGTNIRVRDLLTSEEMFEGPDIRDGKSTFEVSLVEIDYKARTATVHADQPANKLAILLAKLAIRKQ